MYKMKKKWSFPAEHQDLIREYYSSHPETEFKHVQLNDWSSKKDLEFWIKKYKNLHDRQNDKSKKYEGHDAGSCGLKASKRSAQTPQSQDTSRLCQTSK